jgi:hypothetical protein
MGSSQPAQRMSGTLVMDHLRLRAPCVKEPCAERGLSVEGGGPPPGSMSAASRHWRASLRLVFLALEEVPRWLADTPTTVSHGWNLVEREADQCRGVSVDGNRGPPPPLRHLEKTEWGVSACAERDGACSTGGGPPGGDRQGAAVPTQAGLRGKE